MKAIYRPCQTLTAGNGRNLGFWRLRDISNLIRVNVSVLQILGLGGGAAGTGQGQGLSNPMGLGALNLGMPVNPAIVAAALNQVLELLIFSNT